MKGTSPSQTRHAMAAIGTAVPRWEVGTLINSFERGSPWPLLRSESTSPRACSRFTASTTPARRSWYGRTSLSSTGKINRVAVHRGLVLLDIGGSPCSRANRRCALSSRSVKRPKGERLSAGLEIYARQYSPSLKPRTRGSALLFQSCSRQRSTQSASSAFAMVRSSN